MIQIKHGQLDTILQQSHIVLSQKSQHTQHVTTVERGYGLYQNH